MKATGRLFITVLCSKQSVTDKAIYNNRRKQLVTCHYLSIDIVVTQLHSSLFLAITGVLVVKSNYGAISFEQLLHVWQMTPIDWLVKLISCRPVTHDF